jgi:hypothetical protein
MDDHRYPFIIIITTSLLPICSGFLSCYFFKKTIIIYLFIWGKETEIHNLLVSKESQRQ